MAKSIKQAVDEAAYRKAFKAGIAKKKAAKKALRVAVVAKKQKELAAKKAAAPKSLLDAAIRRKAKLKAEADKKAKFEFAAAAKLQQKAKRQAAETAILRKAIAKAPAKKEFAVAAKEIKAKRKEEKIKRAIRGEAAPVSAPVTPSPAPQIIPDAGFAPVVYDQPFAVPATQPNGGPFMMDAPEPEAGTEKPGFVNVALPIMLVAIPLLLG